MPPLDRNAAALLDEVTASFLGAAADTRIARYARDLPREPGWIQRVADSMGLTGAAREHEIVRARNDARIAVEHASAAGLSAVTTRDDEYPPLLKQIADPPLVLWYQGDVALLTRQAVAVVGARDASPSGLTMARQLGRDLARAGVIVVSGMARGVDGAAHEGALEEGKTIAVLGSGVDRVYPREHAQLHRTIRETGAILSEYPAGTPPLQHHFPLRNRIISGLCKAVVVIEAGERSGSLITARAALDQNRDVLAVPGIPLGDRHRGSNGLIKDGARLVETVEDVLDEIRWPRPQQARRVQCDNCFPVSELEAQLDPAEPSTVDELSRKTGRAASDLLAELSVLELNGRVVRASGGFLRVD